MDVQRRLEEAGARAKRAEQRADDPLAAAEWRRYRLIQDAARDPDELIAEGITLSYKAMELATELR
ncbi:MAG TPA: hypothetical protein VFJ61_02430 [Solirubrobacterales bacterium]|nr:hypothetical protein [Solirubrobacterales bacterium]